MKRKHPSTIEKDLSWALECIAIGLAHSTGKPEPAVEMDLLHALCKEAQFWDQLPESEYRTIGEIVISSFDRVVPCDPSTEPVSIRASLPEALRAKIRRSLNGEDAAFSQAELLVLSDELGKAAMVKAWLKRDPIAASKAYVDRKCLTGKATHGAFVESRSLVHWQAKQARQRGGVAANTPYAKPKEQARLYASELVQTNPSITLERTAEDVTERLSKEGHGRVVCDVVKKWINGVHTWKRGRPLKK